MRKLTMNESTSQYGAPVGTYRAKFLGIEDKEHNEYGPGLEWKFEIVGGQYAGKLVSRTTATEARPKNSCGRMLAGLTGGIVTGAAADVDQYVGRTYQVQIEENSTKTGTRVATVMALGETEPAIATLPIRPAALQLAAPTRGPSKPPPQAHPPGPATQPPHHAPDPDKEMYWVLGEDRIAREMTRQAICDKIDSGELSADVPVIDFLEKGEWKPAKDWGLDIPF